MRLPVAAVVAWPVFVGHGNTSLLILGGAIMT